MHRASAEPGCTVTGRLLPRGLCLDAGDEFCVVDEVVEEFVPGSGAYAGIPDHVCQFFDAVVGQCSDSLLRASLDGDDRALGQIVFVADDSLEKFQIFAHHLGCVFERADVGDGCHQAASAFGAARGAQFHGKSSSSRLIL